VTRDLRERFRDVDVPVLIEQGSKDPIPIGIGRGMALRNALDEFLAQHRE
jgi:hypothetical protein